MSARPCGGDYDQRGLHATLLDRIAEVDADRNAFMEVIGDEAVSTARRLDLELAAGRDRGPLHGIPVAIKNASTSPASARRPACPVAAHRRRSVTRRSSNACAPRGVRSCSA